MSAPLELEPCPADPCPWAPLEQLARALPAGTLDPHAFMHMGTSAHVVDLTAWKHYDTRRYLHTDAAGHLYRYDARTGAYSLERDPVTACRRASSLEELEQ